MMQEETLNRTIRIIVATHKQYSMPDDPVYLLLLVGAANNRTDWDKAKDNTGDNISEKNPYYCELTGLYWAWKNVDAEYIGLVHYRRHFADNKWWKNKKERIITETEIADHLKTTDILLPKPRHYWIETNYSQYVHAHHKEDLDFTRKIIQERSPQYLQAFDRVMKKTSGHRFNMMIMKKELLDQYCQWLFDILFRLESILNTTTYSKNDQRVFGFVGERLLDVWLETNQLQFRNIPYVFLENQNWLIKSGKFMMRKVGKNHSKQFG